MENFDFIKNNNKTRNEEQKEIELVCRTIVDDMRSSIYDGSNRYAPKVGVCCKDGKYYWGEHVWDCNCEGLQKWIDSLDCNSIKQYLNQQHTKYVEIPYDDLLTITAVIDRAIAEKESRNDMYQIDVFWDVAHRLHGGKY